MCIYTASLAKIRWICLKNKEIGGKSVDFSKSTEFGGKLRNSEALKTLINITKVQTGNEDLQTNLAGGV